MSEAPNPLPDFAPLGTRISVYQPSATATKPENSPDPLLIILCSWMGASPRHIAKYTAQHQSRFPHAHILLIQNNLFDILFRTPAQQRARIAPAAGYVQAFESSRSESANQKSGKGRIIVHLFSNGGGRSASLLAAALASPAHSSASNAVGLKIDALILDSCPGRAGHARSAKAMAVSIPRTLSFPLQLIAKGLIHMLLVLMKLARILFGISNVVTDVRRDLNSANGAFGKHVPRLYLYSKADEMCGWKDVEDHAAEARQSLGAEVKEIVFTKSPHCGHIFEDAKRYWDAVGEIICQGLG